MRVGKHAGKWSEDPGADRGMVDFKVALAQCTSLLTELLHVVVGLWPATFMPRRVQGTTELGGELGGSLGEL